jgi:hypothetical protein
MLALFLAVPALQRNSRNNQRNSDAALVAASVNECLNNRNGQLTSCNTLALLTANGSLDTSKLRQLNVVAVAAAMPAAGVINTANVAFGNQCQPDGSNLLAAGGTRAFAIAYRIEGTGAADLTKCLSS